MLLGKWMFTVVTITAVVSFSAINGLAATSASLIHDAEQNTLIEQYGDKWKAQDKVLQAKMA